MSAKKSKLRFSNPEEAEAAGAYFGASNLACDFTAQNFDRWLKGGIEPNGQPKWGSLRRAIENHLGGICESDEMYDGMLEECAAWTKQAKRGEAYVVESWKKEVIDKYKLATSLR